MAERHARARAPVYAELAYRLGALTWFGAIAVILAALGFEHIGGYMPCPLCLQQRWAYYAAVPAVFIALAIFSAGHRRLSGLVLLTIGLGFLANAGLGVYHAGAEWGYWPGPSTCSGELQPLSTSGWLLKELGNARVVRCDAASWRFAGLSFAGWNVVASVILFFLALKAAFAAAEPER